MRALARGLVDDAHAVEEDVAGQEAAREPGDEPRHDAEQRRLADTGAPRDEDELALVEAARDMDVLRSALGEETVTYVGASYGTYLGTIYANLFPDRVGRFVLDGAMDPTLEGEEVGRGQAAGFERATRAYVEDCVAQGGCPLGSDVESAMERIPAFLDELDAQPLPVQGDTVTELTEGWAFYVETLGYEIGLYKDPYSRFGQLSNEIWRACRLVVDTGLHTMGWTRQQAIDYMRDNSAKPGHDAEVEVDRYIVWPGQATSYKIGHTEIVRLREDARGRLGARFDLKGFHDAVLGGGAMPLEVLARVVREWTASIA